MAATDGLAMLLRGVPVTKYGRDGGAHSTQLRLSADRAHLTWSSNKLGGAIAGRLGARATRRIMVGEVQEMLIGRESDVFRRHANSRSSTAEVVDPNLCTDAHLSVSLRLRPSTAAPDGGVASARETLDVSFKEEVEFGCFVALMRALLAAHAASRAPHAPRVNRGGAASGGRAVGESDAAAETAALAVLRIAMVAEAEEESAAAESWAVGRREDSTVDYNPFDFPATQARPAAGRPTRLAT